MSCMCVGGGGGESPAYNSQSVETQTILHSALYKAVVSNLAPRLTMVHKNLSHSVVIVYMQVLYMYIQGQLTNAPKPCTMYIHHTNNNYYKVLLNT